MVDREGGRVWREGGVGRGWRWGDWCELKLKTSRDEVNVNIDS